MSGSGEPDTRSITARARPESIDTDCAGAGAPMQQRTESTLDPDCEGAVSQGDGTAAQHPSLVAAAAQAIAG